MGFIDNTLGTNIFGDNGAQSAVGYQNAGTQQANDALSTSYSQQQGYLDPYYQAGAQALSKLGSGQLMNGNQVLQNDPGYQFRLDQGNSAINASMAARGLGNSGAALKELTRYGQDYASNEFNNAYNRQYQSLSSLANMGQNAANGLATAAGNYGSGISNNYTGSANAKGAAAIAQGNQQSNLVGQAMGAAALAFSDRRLKTDIRKISKEEISEMRKDLKAFYFKYKDELHGKGVWPGVMAQDLEKSSLGRWVVEHDGEGHKQVNMNKVMSIFLATMAYEEAA